MKRYLNDGSEECFMRVNTYKVYLSNYCGEKFQIEVITPYQYNSSELVSILRKNNISGMYMAWFDNALTELCDTEVYDNWNVEEDYIIRV